MEIIKCAFHWFTNWKKKIIMESTPDQLSVPAAVVKLSRDEEDYLDRLLTEKKVVDATAGLDCTQKLINAGKSRFEIAGQSFTRISNKNKKYIRPAAADTL